jgi:hypothetical protein
MITLDDILRVTAEVMGVKKEKVASGKKIDETHQIARIVCCRIAVKYRYGYKAIGEKIGRSKRAVCHNVNFAKTNGYLYEAAMQEVESKLEEIK